MHRLASTLELDSIPSATEPNAKLLRAPLLIHSICERLDDRGISYCHWKSNWRLDKWLLGGGDLDLLVARSHAGEFAKIIGELGFKQVASSPGKTLPGVVSYYAMDATTGEWIHIHAHYQLVLGHDLTKNYHLPIEGNILATRVRRSGVFVTEPEHELALFVIRMLLKLNPSEAFLRTLVGKPALTEDAVPELADLYQRCRPDRFREVLWESFPFLDERFFEQCRFAIGEQLSLPARLGVCRELHRRVDLYGRRDGIADAMVRSYRAVDALWNRIRHRKSRSRPYTGGAVIAIVGGDGAGKSTTVAATYQWLSRRFETRRVHLGRPQRSLPTLAVCAALRLRRILRARRSGEGTWPGEDPEDVLELARRTFLACDRYRLYTRIRRAAANGTLVICDRYPIDYIRMMDGPTELPLGRPVFKFEAVLRRLQANSYRRILPPDLLIVLRLHPDLAVERKPEEEANYVRARSREIWEKNWDGSGALIVDASRPLPSVLTQVRNAIWSRL